MTAATAETAGGGGDDADALRESPMNVPTQGILGGIMLRKRPDPAAIRQEECLPISESAIESSEGPIGGRWPEAIQEIPGETAHRRRAAAVLAAWESMGRQGAD
jgi:hypothetical protein